jgi:hypothetical protein
MSGMIGLFCLRETLSDLRSASYADDATRGSLSHGARPSGGSIIYGVFDEWTRMRAQNRDLRQAQALVKANPGWQIREIIVSRANTAYSLIHHGRGIENEMYRQGVDQKEILPGAIQRWKGARAMEESDADDLQELVVGGDWPSQD